MFRGTPVITFRTGMRAFRLKLWDAEREPLVPFPARGARLGDPGPETLPAN
jgi:hypothetical protein